jgi:putative transcriptional regulator
MKNNLKVLRAIKNISQEDLAKEIGVSRQTINAMEKGKYAPSTILALKLARFFEKTVDEIFTLEADHLQLNYDHLIFFTLDILKHLAQRADLDVLYMHEYKRVTGEIDLIMLAKKRAEGNNLLKIKPLDFEFH